MGFGRLDIGTVGSNPTQNMNTSPSFCVLCCPVEVQALYWADCPTDGGVLPNVKMIHNIKRNSELKQVTRPNP
jgi:hypothetical protein